MYWNEARKPLTDEEIEARLRMYEESRKNELLEELKSIGAYDPDDILASEEFECLTAGELEERLEEEIKDLK